ncbi:hypothetical protein SAMN05421835_111178 [Amycolatopsis sacchari]|uniref:Uncharacterized protein n=1 Tax=Amycolatopsis sacchari TaxID=115433 RepID=A0A1I3VR32_9PSEU|nr:hypothetical protein [Amycolatopsis sacchari]SFJ97848.1 hypothetical protein SAMN05421835_111178 [Amycolatopsis sacchari]
MNLNANGEIEALVAELKRVRKGPGIQARSLPDVAGAPLRRACGVLDTDPPGRVRDKIVRTLADLVERLPEAHRATARAVFGFGTTAGLRYTARLAQLGQVVDRDMRTMQRRADDVVYLVAELAATRPPPEAPEPVVPWHTTALAVSLIPDGPGAEVFETREIVSHVADLEEIEHSISLGRAPGVSGPVDLGELGIEVLRGGEVHSTRMVSSTRVAFQLRPPRVLAAGDRHEFFVRMRVPRILPFYCCTPEFPCERFRLNIRFDRVPPPARLWRIDGELSKDADDPLPARKPLSLDGTEVHADFEGLLPARSYGIGWQPA